jgi:hypothetical protein
MPRGFEERSGPESASAKKSDSEKIDWMTVIDHENANCQTGRGGETAAVGRSRCSDWTPSARSSRSQIRMALHDRHEGRRMSLAD